MENKNLPAYPAELEHDENGDIQPVNRSGAFTGIYPGLSKRELIAAMALQGILANNTNGGDRVLCASAAILCADELLKQLNA